MQHDTANRDDATLKRTQKVEARIVADVEAGRGATVDLCDLVGIIAGDVVKLVDEAGRSVQAQVMARVRGRHIVSRAKRGQA